VSIEKKRKEEKDSVRISEIRWADAYSQSALDSILYNEM
jgi:hypothetical protein